MSLYKWICQKIADYYFYKWLSMPDRHTNLKALKAFNNYHKWIDYKFKFTKKD